MGVSIFAIRLNNSLRQEYNPPGIPSGFNKSYGTDRTDDGRHQAVLTECIESGAKLPIQCDLNKEIGYPLYDASVANVIYNWHLLLYKASNLFIFFFSCLLVVLNEKRV